MRELRAQVWSHGLTPPSTAATQHLRPVPSASLRASERRLGLSSPGPAPGALSSPDPPTGAGAVLHGVEAGPD
jgi:hypothetical protein